MSDRGEAKSGGFPIGPNLGLVGLVGGLAALGLAAWYWLGSSDDEPQSRRAGIAEATRQQVQQLCGVCHAYPPPESLPRNVWRHEVQRGFEFRKQAGLPVHDDPSQAAVLAYYENRAPPVLPVPERKTETRRPPKFERRDYVLADSSGLPAISHVRFANYSDEKKLDVLACDMINGRILLLRPYEAEPRITVLCEGLRQPAHVEVVDLDADGVKDLLVANLGNFYPTNDKCGSVVWLRGSKAGVFTPHTLLEGVGRVADVQAADLNGDGKLDLAVAAFGWTATGEVYYLRNETTDYGRPAFAARVLDGRHGAIHVPIADLNGDGHPDIVALTSQEHETVVAFLNDGKGEFTARTVFSGPHPAFGSSGIQLVDFNRDGRLDVLLTNGDSLDSVILRPYHGVRWLENRGRFPFAEHFLASMYGVHRALAADFEGSGRRDVLAVSLLPRPGYGHFRKQLSLDSIIYLRQTPSGEFSRFSLESVACDHACADVGDFDADGLIDWVTGGFLNFGPLDQATRPGDAAAPWISVSRNLSPIDASQ